MNKLLLLCLLGISTTFCFAQNKEIKYIRFNVDLWNSNITIDNNTEIILDYRPENNSAYPAWRPARVNVICTSDMNETYPLFITSNQQTLTQSWQLPMRMDESDGYKDYNYFSRTLCPTDSDSVVNWPLVHLTTENPSPLNLQILVELLEKYEIQLANKTDPQNGWMSTDLRVNAPQYYSFHFPSHAETSPSPLSMTTGELLPKIKSPQTVILMLESESPACMIVSVQNLTCPVYDDEETVKHKGNYFTMMDKGGLTLSQAEYPVGFYVVLFLKASDEECSGSSAAHLLYAEMQSSQVKPVRFRVIETISYEQYVIAVLAVLGVIIAYLCLIAFISAATKMFIKRNITTVNAEDPVSTIVQNVENTINGENRPNEEIVTERESESLLSLPESRQSLTLAHMCLLNDAARKSRSDKYLWGIVIISVFYSLPVVQLVVTYQWMAQNTGDRDLCYYNFLCAHPLYPLGDANHVFSNVGYILLGSIFLIIVRRREIRYTACRQLQTLGIPQHFGLYYAMGVSLLMEGLLSGTYHICPNKMNFQFDSSFMYVMCVLCMVKLYQSRHPDINAKAHATFAVLACVIFMGFSEILFTYSNTETYTGYWLMLCYFKLVFVLWLSCKIYYMGNWTLNSAGTGFRRFFHELMAGTLEVKPTNVELFLLVVCLNVVNFAFDMYGFERARQRARDIPVHLLQVLLLNTILCIIIYICMKVKYRERVTAKAVMSLVISNSLWALSLYFFINGRTKWAWTPAHSRSRNAPCTLLDTFDTHDIWHLTSAAALFHTFLLLLTIDDDLARTPREQIAVF